MAANLVAGNRELVMLVDVLAREKNVPRDIVFGALEMALASATKKKYSEDIDVRVHVDQLVSQPGHRRLHHRLKRCHGRVIAGAANKKWAEAHL